MLRIVAVVALTFVGPVACERDPEQPRGEAWQPCLEDNRCSNDSLSCLEVFGSVDVTACLPWCSAGDKCVGSPVNENGAPTSSRCSSSDTNPGRCLVDCSSAADCPAGMLCFFDERYTLSSAVGICAWPPP